MDMTVPERGGRKALSYSALGTHRRCPQAWAYQYVDGLRKDGWKDSLPREFGSMWHAVRAISSIDRGVWNETLQYAPEELTTGDLSPTFSQVPGKLGSYAAPGFAQFKHEYGLLDNLDLWFERLPEDARALWLEVFPEGPITRLRAMNARWLDRWAEEIAHEDVLAVEFGAERKLSDGYTLRGRVDEVYLDRRLNMVVVRDAKSHKTIPEASAADNLMDSQLHLYAWIITPEVTKWGHGEPRALAYDRVRTAQAKTPAVTKSGTLSKSVTDYDLATYLEFTREPVPFPGLKKDGSGAGTYAADPQVIERLDTPEARDVWTRRTVDPVNVNIVLAHLRSAQDTAQDQERTRNRYLSTGYAARNLSRSACDWCDFQGLCRAQMLGGRGNDTVYSPSDFGLRKR